MSDPTLLASREALARALCQDRDCCDDGCYAGLRSADALLASGVVQVNDPDAAQARADQARADIDATLDKSQKVREDYLAAHPGVKR